MSLYIGDKVKVLNKSIGQSLESILSLFNLNEEQMISSISKRDDGEHVYRIRMDNRDTSFLERDLKLISREIPIGTKVKIPYTKKGVAFSRSSHGNITACRERAVENAHNYMFYGGFRHGEYCLRDIEEPGGDYYNLDEIEPYDEPFRVGDMCVFAPYLQVGEAYGVIETVTFLEGMEIYKTQSFKIETVCANQKTYMIEPTGFGVSHEMLIKVGQVAQTAPITQLNNDETQRMNSEEVETQEEPEQEERRETQMKWRTVEGELEVGNRIKCTWETYVTDGENHDVELCTRTHELRAPRPNVRHTTNLVKIPGTRNEDSNKEVIIYKDTDGWLIIKTVGQHLMQRGTSPRTFYQAVCPEHVPAYELEQSLINAQAVRAEERNQTETARNEEGIATAQRLREEQQRAGVERVRMQREEEVERIRRQAEEARRRLEEREREEALRAEKFNIWTHHEKNEIL